VRTTYKLHYFEGGREVASETWRYSLREAKSKAEEIVAYEFAERVEVRDKTGKLLFDYPQVTRASSP